MVEGGVKSQLSSKVSTERQRICFEFPKFLENEAQIQDTVRKILVETVTVLDVVR